MEKHFKWINIIPILAWVSIPFGLSNINTFTQIIAGILLVGAILAAVQHSENIAHKVGEPYGTLILAVAITIIEVALIISLTISGGEKTAYLARDTVFSSVMILLNAVIGICLLVGGTKHFEQFFEKKSVNIALVSLVAILVLTLILPNFTTSIKEPTYTTPQLIFVAFACLLIYGTFLSVQTSRHRNYFVSDTPNKKEKLNGNTSSISLYIAIPFLILSLTIVVILAKSLSPIIESSLIDANLPQSLLGIIIAAIVLLPEGIAAIKAAYRNDIQTSLNLSLGSALAAIGLTIPSIAIVSSIYDLNIILGLDKKAMVFLGLSIFTVMLSLSKGKTNILYGIVLIVNFVAFIITTIFP
jgi:Ca2+:H+ antiporter